MIVKFIFLAKLLLFYKKITKSRKTNNRLQLTLGFISTSKNILISPCELFMFYHLLTSEDCLLYCLDSSNKCGDSLKTPFYAWFFLPKMPSFALTNHILILSKHYQKIKKVHQL